MKNTKAFISTCLIAIVVCINGFSQTIRTSNEIETIFDFESGNISGWAKQNPGAGIDITQEDKYSGNYALKMANGSGTDAWSVQAFTPVIGITGGHQYKVSFWIKAVGGGGQGRISTVDDNQLGTSQYWSDFDVSAEWKQIVYNNLTAKSNILQLAFDLGFVANKVYYIDDIVIEDLTPEAKDGTEPFARDHSKFLGNIISYDIPVNFDRYWNQITPENASKWGSVERVRGNMEWAQLDLAYNHAKNKKYPFKFHTFVWGQQEPSWLVGLSETQQLAELNEFMQAVAARYPDIDFIDVVNEPLNAPSSMRAALGGDGKTGWDWIIKSFELARQYFPNAKLHLNDYTIISSVFQANRYLQIINLLKDRGLIDGIGIQCHEFNINTASAHTITQVLNLLGSTNIPVYVSELDISSQSENEQLDRYIEKFPLLWEHEAVAGVTLWGYISGRTWKENTGIIEQNGTERKAMKWLKSYMASDASKVSNKYTGIEVVEQNKSKSNIVFVNFINNELHISTPDNSLIKHVVLFDLTGKILLTQNNIGMYITAIPLQTISSGIYMCSLETEKGRFNQKISIK